MSPTRLPTDLAIFAACLAMTACAGPRHGRPPTAGTAERASESPTAFEVVVVRYAAAPELAMLLRNVVDPRNVRVQADARTNSLLLAGSGAEIAAVKAVIAELDVEVAARP